MQEGFITGRDASATFGEREALGGTTVGDGCWEPTVDQRGCSLKMVYWPGRGLVPSTQDGITTPYGKREDVCRPGLALDTEGEAGAVANTVGWEGRDARLVASSEADDRRQCG